MIRVKWLWLFSCLSWSVSAENITLPNQLSNGSVANADDVQANFDTLLNESNDNDQRIFQNQTTLQSIQISVRGFEYEWLGYTEDPYVVTGGTDKAIGPSLSMFCKEQFGDPSASVANLTMLEQVMRSQALPLPPENTAWVIFSPDYVVGRGSSYSDAAHNAFWGDTWTDGSPLCWISPAATYGIGVGCGASPTQASERAVACVKRR